LARDKWLSNAPPSAIGFMFRINASALRFTDRLEYSAPGSIALV
jgi:hypothetical protein